MNGKRLGGCVTAVEYCLVLPFPSCLRSCLVNVRRFFAQRYSPFDMGDLRVLAPTRRTLVRLRVAVLRKSPHLKRFRPARPLARPSGSRYARRFPTKASLSSAHLRANKRRVGTFDIVRLADSSLFTVESHLRRTKRKYVMSSPAHIRASRHHIKTCLGEV